MGRGNQWGFSNNKWQWIGLDAEVNGRIAEIASQYSGHFQLQSGYIHRWCGGWRPEMFINNSRVVEGDTHIHDTTVGHYCESALFWTGLQSFLDWYLFLCQPFSSDVHQLSMFLLTMYPSCSATRIECPSKPFYSEVFVCTLPGTLGFWFIVIAKSSDDT